MGRRLQDRVEDLATERYGRGTALETERIPTGWTVRIWNAKGVEVASVTHREKEEALRTMKDLIIGVPGAS